MDVSFLSTKGIKSAQPYIPFLEHYCEVYSINTPKRLAAFLANVAHESQEFTHIKENLNYSAEGLAKTWPLRFKSYDGSPNAIAIECAHNPEKIANTVYCNRMGNGSSTSGDGWKYAGKGLLQITGRENYTKCAKSMGIDIVGHPELLLEPKSAVASACWYWESRNLNKVADRGDMTTITNIINGGTNGLNERMAYYEKALKILGE